MILPFFLALLASQEPATSADTVQAASDSVHAVPALATGSTSDADSLRGDSTPPPAAAPPPTPPAPRPAATVATSTRSLGLDSAVERMIEGNADLHEAILNWIGQNSLRKSSWGVFEPKFTASVSEKEQGSENEPHPDRRENLRTALKGLLPTGTSWELSYEHNAVRNPDTKTLSLVQSSVTLRQPLLRGLLYGGSWNTILSTRAGERKSFHELRKTLADLFSDLLEAWWDTYTAERQLAFDSTSVAVARDLLSDGARRAARGLISPLELERIASELATRQARQLDARRRLGEARTRLSLVLGDSSGAEPWSPTARLELDDDSTLLPDSLDGLLANQPELGAARGEVERLKAERNARRSRSLPMLDLTGSLGKGASAYSDISAMRKYDDPSRVEGWYSAGVEVEVPLLGDLQERGAARAADMSYRAAQVRQVQTELKLRRNARDLSERARSYREASRQQAQVVRYHETALVSELRRLRAGLSTYQVVYEVEEKLREAQKAQLDAVRAYRLSRAQLDKTAGTLLASLGLETIRGSKVVLRDDFVSPLP